VTRSALVTGGGTGIGAAVARRLAQDGFRVAVAGRRREPLEAVAAETGGIALPGDMADEAEVARVVRAASEALGGLDVLVCAAGTGASGTVAEQTLERWSRVLATNLTLCGVNGDVPFWNLCSIGFGRGGLSAAWSPIHGLIYFVYVISIANLGFKVGWSLPRMVLTMLSGFVPVLPFVVERRVRREVEGRIAGSLAV